MRILIVEDGRGSSSTIGAMLRRENFICDVVDPGDGSPEIEHPRDYDAVLLIARRPESAGYRMLRRWRAAGVDMPVLILLQKAELEPNPRDVGLEPAEFVPPPFDGCELPVRVRAAVRRFRGCTMRVVRTGQLVVDLDARFAAIDGRPLTLTGKEYGVLELLSLRQGTTVTKEMFLAHLCGGINEPEIKIIDVFVCKLRRKLAVAAGGAHYIETVWGRGYALREPSAAAAGAIGGVGLEARLPAFAATAATDLREAGAAAPVEAA